VRSLGSFRIVSDFISDLQTALGPGFRVLRELGGGGMSRVFVAEELALGREVAVKVIAPDVMPGMSVDRFRLEMQVAARLQHPAIVPVLGTGSANGLTWFTMPMVAGETLRARLARETRLPMADVLRLTRDLFEALGTAHAAGVVHRDIKPENLFVSNRHLLVADFGVARAISQSTNTGDARLTGVGVALGTPAYMAPEQALADALLDHRADLYSAGLVVYEMLSGALPFEATTPQAFLAAHLSTPPAPLQPLRTDTPPALAALVMQCLEKEPAKRPATAAEVLERLEHVSGTQTPLGLPAAARRRRAAPLVVAAIAAAVLGYGAYRQLAAPQATAMRDLVVVGQFAHAAGDASLAGAVQQALRIDLGQSSRVRVPDPGRMRSTLRAMERADTTPLAGVVLQELARRLGAKAWIDGEVARAGSGFVLTARLITVDGERELAALRESARDSSAVLEAIDRLARSLREKAGESVQSLEARQPLPLVTTRSLAALERVAEGQALILAGRSPQAIEKFRQAVALDSNFATAWRGLAVAMGNAGSKRSERLAASRRAYELRERLPDTERLSIEGNWYQNLREYEKAAASWRELMAIDPENSAGPNNLGIALNRLGRHQEAIAVLEKARRMTPNSATLITNLIDVYLEIGDTLNADRIIADAKRIKNPSAANFAARRLVVTRQVDAALAIADSVLRDSPDAPTYRAATRGAFELHLTRGELAASDRLAKDVASRARAEGDVSLAWGAAMGLAASRMEYLSDTAGAIRTLDAVRREVLASSVDPLDRPYLGLAQAYATVGREADARGMVARFRAENPPEFVQRDTLELALVSVYSSIKQKRYAEALALTEKAAALEPSCSAWCFSSLFARIHSAMGNADSTLAHTERHLQYRGSERAAIDAYDLPWVLKRSGELYESRGETAKAIARYRELVELWRNADAPLQPLVSDLKQRIAKLEAKRG
jgi:tetratricopeptide (TPR) repeat protein